MNLGGKSQIDQARIEWGIRLRFSPMPRLDIGGNYILISRASYGSISAANAAWKAAWALMQQQGTIVETPPDGDVTLTFAGAILKSVKKVRWIGEDLSIRYEFTITTCT